MACHLQHPSQIGESEVPRRNIRLLSKGAPQLIHYYFFSGHEHLIHVGAQGPLLCTLGQLGSFDC